MISVNTAPGTKVVCVNNDPDAFSIPGIHYRKAHKAFNSLNVGDIYTVREIHMSPSTKSGFSVIVDEIESPLCTGLGRPSGFDVGRFNYLQLNKLDTSLPDSITRLLKTKRLDELVRETEKV